MLRQVIKYGVIGAGNTLLTFMVYVVMTEALGISKGTSNMTGYAVGLVNSFIWNKKWTFKKEGQWLKSSVIFLLMFLICYAMQKLLFDALNRHLHINHTLNFIMAMLFYNIIFFLSNKYVIFSISKSNNEQ